MIARVWCFSILVWVLFLVGCQEPTPEVFAPTPVPTAVVNPSPTPPVLPPKIVPTPEQGKGALYGQFLQEDGAAAVGYPVVICQDFSQYGACQGRRYVTVTEMDGTYVIEDVEPGQYVLMIHLDDEEEMPLQIMMEETSQISQFVVADQQLLKIEPLFLLDNALRAIRPTGMVRLPKETVASGATGTVQLRWRLHPEAVAYEVYLAPEKGEAVFVAERVAEGEVTAVLPRLNCHYQWQVTAFNRANIEIAIMSKYARFEVIGEEDDCELPLVAPPPNATLSSAEAIKLDWEAPETADHYRVWLVNETHNTTILDFMEVSNSHYKIPNRLLPAHYIWAVFVYDATGHMVAESEILKFEVVAEN